MPIAHATAWVFALSALGIVYTFIGYPVLIRLLAGLRKPLVSSGRLPDETFVSVVMCVHNGEALIESRLANLLDTQWPLHKLEIIVVSDGSTDGTDEILQRLASPSVRVIRQPARKGKPAGLNAGFAAARGDLVVLCDVRQTFTPETIPNLLRHFTNPEVGAVSGALHIQKPASNVGGGVDAYWRLEKAVREAESRVDSCIGCTGAVYAVRREAFRPLPEDTLIDDVEIPMQIAMQGHRVLFDPEARALDPQSLEPERERVRKRRTLAGNYQMLFRHPGWLLPWRNRLWWQLISHKYMRLAAPFLMLVALASNALLLEDPLFQWLFMGQCLFHALAAAGCIAKDTRIRVLSLPAGFVFLNLMSMAGLWHYLRGSHRQGWEIAKP